MFDVLETQHWAFSNDIFPLEFCRELAQECQLIANQGQLKKAHIGVGLSKTQNNDIRGDFIYWLDAEADSSVQKEIQQFLFQIQNFLNKNFYLGLKRIESHFAFYPEGAGYEKHVDNHRGVSSRKITFIIYLNENWALGHGGELSIYSPEDEMKLLAQVEPRLGTFVLFRSEMFPHQVEKSHRARMSLTGWFRDDAL